MKISSLNYKIKSLSLPANSIVSTNCSDKDKRISKTTRNTNMNSTSR